MKKTKKIKRKAQIPSKFKVLSHEYKIIYKNDLLEKDNCLGEIDFQELTIALQKSNKKNIIADTSLEQTFWHEIVHCILNYMGEDKLNDKEEKFVNLFGELLYQIVSSSNFKIN